MSHPTTHSPRQRLDTALVARGLSSTRARARDLVLRGEVLVDGETAAKPAMPIGAGQCIQLRSGPADYVSRGALKLEAALDHFGFDPAGLIAIDVGASTGGFTETLLKRGARRVFAVDNGRDQLHARLRADPRVVALDETDARRLDRELIPEPADAIVADVSFIGLAKALPAALALAAPVCWLVALIKPQFELTPGRVPRTGVVRDPAVRADAIAGVRAWLGGLAGWQVIGTIESPLAGGDGNVEALIGARRHG